MATKLTKPADPRQPAVHVKDMEPKATASGGATTTARTGNVFTITFGGSL